MAQRPRMPLSTEQAPGIAAQAAVQGMRTTTWGDCEHRSAPSLRSLVCGETPTDQARAPRIPRWLGRVVVSRDALGASIGAMQATLLAAIRTG